MLSSFFPTLFPREEKFHAPIMNAARVCFHNYSKPPSSVDCFPWRRSLLINMNHDVLAADETLHIIGCILLPLQPPLVYVLNIVWTKKKKPAGLSGARIEDFTHSLVNYLWVLHTQKVFIDSKFCTSNLDLVLYYYLRYCKNWLITGFSYLKFILRILFFRIFFIKMYKCPLVHSFGFSAINPNINIRC